MDISLLLGFIMPFIVSLMKKDNMNADQRFALTAIIAGVMGVAAVIVSGQFAFSAAGLHAMVLNSGVVLGEATVVYKLILSKYDVFSKPTPAPDPAPAPAPVPAPAEKE